MGKTQHTADEIRAIVDEIVAANQPEQYRLLVGDPAFVDVAPDTQLWTVPIHVSDNEIDATEFVHRLVDLEMKLRDKLGDELDIELIPGDTSA